MTSKLEKYNFHFWLYFIVSALLIQIPVVSIPFNWIETFFHEISHGLATLITGGSISKIELLPDGAGFCYSYGGWQLLIAFSGYAGASGFGLLIYQIASSSSHKVSKLVSFSVLALIAVCLIFWVRDLLTVMILAVIALIFALPLKFASSTWLIHVTRLIGISLILNGLFSVINLIGRSNVGDAANLARLTWIPAQIWVLLWCVIGCLALYRAFNLNETVKRS